MASGETLLKITDFPFAYSLSTLVGGLLGLSFSNHGFIILLGAAGALGTFLTITDPVGRLLKLRLRNELKQKKVMTTPNSKLVSKVDYSIRAIETRSIRLEVDKLVGLSYFVIILLAFSTAMAQSDAFVERIQLKQDNGEIVCDTDCVRNTGYLVTFIAAVIVVLVGRRNWNELKKHIETAATHQLGISSEFVTRSTIENMSRTIEQNDWSTAEEWAFIVEKEIQTQKGRREFLIKAIEEVYRPLYLENIGIESTCNSIKNSGNYQGMPTANWSKIKSDGNDHMIEDANLREEIDRFYDLLKEYNRIQGGILGLAEKIVKNRLQQFYGPNIGSINYWVRSSQGESAPSLSPLILTGTHPLEVYPKDTNPIPTKIDLYPINQSRMEVLNTEKDFEKFEEFWKMLLEDTRTNPQVQKIRELFKEIPPKNDELRKKFSEKIRMQTMF